jgi:hypothetical protein
MILAGDWMPLKIFINDQGRFRLKQDAFGTERTNGWWNCLAAGDLDADGDIDFVAGNHGLNSRFKASPEKPVSMYVNDFDLNGSAEQIICIYDGDKSYPLALKHDLVGQIPGLAQKYPRYILFKDAQITDMFSPEQLKRSVYLDVSLFETSLFINDGAGHFTRKPLPPEVQFSPVYAIDINDYNNDGHPDIVFGGNLHNVKPEVGRYDASYGGILLGTGRGEFIYTPPKHSGLHLSGEIRDIMVVTSKGGKMLLAAGSNQPLQVYKIADR